LKRWKQQVAAFALTVLASWGIYALLGLGIVLVYRTSRILNIAGGEIAMFIGYVGALAVADGLPFLIAVALAAAAAMALGLAIFWLAIRRVMGEPPHVGLILTVGIGTILNGFMIVLFGGGMVAIPTALPAFTTIGSLRLPTPDVVAAVGAWLCIATIALVYGLTNLGLQMRAVAERVMLSAQRGLNVDRTVALSWMLGILATGLAGILHGERALIALSASVIGVSALIACLIGGMDSIKGVVLAALIVALTENFTALYLDPRYVLIAPVVILLVILIVRPWGLFGTVEELRRV
jgi:branched-chain amino acid transport system permease protein